MLTIINPPTLLLISVGVALLISIPLWNIKDNLKNPNIIGSNDLIFPKEKEVIDDKTPSRLKFKKSWFSKHYVTPYFYHKGKWITLNTVSEPFGSPFKKREIEPISWKLDTYSENPFLFEKQKYSTLCSCLENNRKAEEECIRVNKNIAEEKERNRLKRKEAMKKLNY